MPTSPKACLRSLREILLKENLQGFILPHGDEFQNEFLPPESRRLSYATGFDGSAGLAIVLPHCAALFVDGRYTVAAKEHVDPTLFSTLTWSSHTIETFLRQNCHKQDVLGFFSETMTHQDFELYTQITQPLHLTLRPLFTNHIDTIWKSRPVSFPKEGFLHNEKYTGEAHTSKRKRIAELLKKEGVEALYSGSSENINWLLNIRGHDLSYTPLLCATALLYQNGEIDVFTDLRKIPSSFASHFGPGVRFHETASFSSILSQLKHPFKLWIDPSHTSFGTHHLLEEMKCIVTQKEDPIFWAKALKNTTEIQGMMTCHKRDGCALVRFLSWLEDHVPSASLTELKAQEKIIALRQELDLYFSESFTPISAVNEHAAIVHYHAQSETNTPLQKGNLYLLDSGGQFFDGTTDVTRTVLLGKDATAKKEIKEMFTRVLKGHIALAQTHFPKGTAGFQLDVLARQFLWEEGRDYPHGTGHGVGSFLAVHEKPQRISKLGNSPLELGMVLSNEPGYYHENAFGIRIENLMLVIPSPENPSFYTFKTLTLAPIDQNLILPDLLNNSEKEWLNTYHKRVWKEISPHLDMKEKEWLQKATRPL